MRNVQEHTPKKTLQKGVAKHNMHEVNNAILQKYLFIVQSLLQSCSCSIYA